MEKMQLSTGVTLAYQVLGNPNGIPIVLVHGYTSRGASYAPLIPLLEKHFRILSFDQRGHGDSDKPLGKTYEETQQLYSLDTFAGDLKDLVEKVKFPVPFVIMGHSMGGMITQTFVLAYPQMVSKVILGSTIPTYKTDAMQELVKKYKKGEMQVSEANYRMMLAIGYSTRFRKEHPELMEQEIQWKLKVPKDVYIACMDNFVNTFDVREQLKTITQPALVITGDRDGLIQYTNSQFIAGQIPGAKLVIIPKISHGIMHEATETVYNEIAALCGVTK